MRVKSLTLLATTVALATFPAPHSAAAPWTLDEAIAQAAVSSPDALIARQRLEAANALVEQANSANAPRVNLSASYMQTNNPMMAFGSILSQGAFNFGLDFNNPGQVDNLNVAGTVGYNLYSGGRKSAGIAAARQGAESAGFDRTAALEELAAGVTRAFYGILQAREGVAALEAAEKAITESLRVARLRHDEGQMLKSEMLNLEVRLGETRDQLLGMRHSEALARRQLAFLIGIEAGDSVEIASPPEPAPADIAPGLTLENRPELQSMRRRVSAAERMVEVARSGRRPSVNAFASYQYDHGWRLDGHGDSWTAGVKADWPIFDGRETSGRVHQAEAEFAQAREGLRKLELALGLQLEQARLAQNLAVSQLDTATTLVAQASESAEISRARFETGALLSAELIGVETRLAEARMRLAIARARLAVAASDLKRAAGVSLLPNN